MKSLRSKTPNQTPLDVIIENHLSAMAGMAEGSEEYGIAARNLIELMKAKDLEPKPNRISAETWAGIAANLLGIFAVLHYEQANVLTSKAFNMVRRPGV